MKKNWPTFDYYEIEILRYCYSLEHKDQIEYLYYTIKSAKDRGKTIFNDKLITWIKGFIENKEVYKKYKWYGIVFNFTIRGIQDFCKYLELFSLQSSYMKYITKETKLKIAQCTGNSGADFEDKQRYNSLLESIRMTKEALGITEEKENELKMLKKEISQSYDPPKIIITEDDFLTIKEDWTIVFQNWIYKIHEGEGIYAEMIPEWCVFAKRIHFENREKCEEMIHIVMLNKKPFIIPYERKYTFNFNLKGIFEYCKVFKNENDKLKYLEWVHHESDMKHGCKDEIIPKVGDEEGKKITAKHFLMKLKKEIKFLREKTNNSYEIDRNPNNTQENINDNFIKPIQWGGTDSQFYRLIDELRIHGLVKDEGWPIPVNLTSQSQRI